MCCPNFAQRIVENAIHEEHGTEEGHCGDAIDTEEAGGDTSDTEEPWDK